MKKKVTMVTLNVWKQATPLVSGYLQAYAMQDAAITELWDFEFYNETSDISQERLTTDLQNAAADVYAMSCYVWNMGLFKQTIFNLLDANPNAQILLGGPQVMNHAHKYLRPEYENIAVCNGEGEKTFHNYLKALMTDSVDLTAVNGLSFYRDGELITTESEQRIQDLDEIPSPFLQGLFDSERYLYAMIETNRGCPFTCNYCYWGAAIGTKVHRMDEERVLSEFDWIAENSVPYISINDANWGMLKRDVTFAKHIATRKEEYDFPHGINYCTAKNSQQRVSEISAIFHEAELFVTHPVSLQTLNEEALRKVQRQNIKANDYELLQQSMNEREITSYIELIWPLPGETLTSFKQGINQLCVSGASSFACWPLLLMNNVGLNDHREEYGLVTAVQEDTNSEAEVVIQTDEVNQEECQEGWRFLFTLNLLYCMRGLYYLGGYLNERGILSYAELYSTFVDFTKERPETQFATKMEAFVPAALSDRIWEIGLSLHDFLHVDRATLGAVLFEFVSTQPWWEDELAQVLFEVDQLNIPYPYANLALEKPVIDFQHVQWVDLTPTGYCIQLPAAYRETIRKRLGSVASFQDGLVEVNHRQKQLMYFHDGHTKEHYANYVLNSMITVRDLVPDWRDCI